MAGCSRLRQRLGAGSEFQLVAVQRRQLELGGRLRLYLGRKRTVGLGAVSLRSLVLRERLRLGVVSASVLRLSVVVSGAGRVLRLRRGRSGMECLGRLRVSLHRLVPARSVRTVLSVVSRMGLDRLRLGLAGLGLLRLGRLDRKSTR